MPDKRALRKILIEGILWQSRLKTQRFHCQGLSLIPGQGTKIAPATWHAWSKKKRERERDRKTQQLKRTRDEALAELPHQVECHHLFLLFLSRIFRGQEKLGWEAGKREQ